MKTFARFIGSVPVLVGMALAGIPLAVGVAAAADRQLISSPSTASDDTPGNEDGDGEGGGVVDPVPQDDGSPGTEDN